MGLQSGTSTPAIDQLLKDGRVSVLSGKASEHSNKPSEHSTDIFESKVNMGEGLFNYEERGDKNDKEKEIVSLDDQFQRLQTS